MEIYIASALIIFIVIFNIKNSKKCLLAIMPYMLSAIVFAVAFIFGEITEKSNERFLRENEASGFIYYDNVKQEYSDDKYYCFKFLRGGLRPDSAYVTIPKEHLKMRGTAEKYNSVYFYFDEKYPPTFGSDPESAPVYDRDAVILPDLRGAVLNTVICDLIFIGLYSLINFICILIIKEAEANQKEEKETL